MKFFLIITIFFTSVLAATFSNNSNETKQFLKTIKNKKITNFRALKRDNSPLPKNYRPILNRMPKKKLRSVTNDFNITYLNAGQQDASGESCVTFPEDAKAVFERAAEIWSSYIVTNVPITIEACWASLGAGYLGYSASNMRSNFTNAPHLDTWYNASLANSFAGVDLDPEDYDSYITYNSDVSFYYGLDGNTPSNKSDLLSVVLHEMAHTLNFSGALHYDSGNGFYQTHPGIYDRFTEIGDGTALISYSNPSTQMGSALTSDDVWFNGTNANAANGNSRVKLYTPSTWSPGSSYSHLDYSTYNNTPNGLMVYQLTDGEAIHDPGDITLGILEDMGWTIYTPPPVCSYTISPLNANFTPLGASNAILIESTPDGCVNGSWDASENLSWVTITSASTGSGSGTWSLDYDVSENTSFSRNGTINISGNIHTINQEGVKERKPINPSIIIYLLN